jgi:ABC-type nitrate/sulfonate/bicarbonate transport system substrate-binding protein
MRTPSRSHGRLAVAIALTLALGAATACSSSGASASGSGKQTVSLAQPLQILGYADIDAARAGGEFSKAGINLEYSTVSGGDANLLAAVPGGIDLGAPGTAAVLLSVAKGKHYQAIYCLDEEMSLNLVVSDNLLKRTGTSPTQPLQQRLQALKGATIGVSSLSGLQGQVAHYYVQAAKLSTSDVKIVQIGPPPALMAALQHGEIDAFVLSPPEGQVAKAGGVGETLVRGSELPALQPFCDLALVTTQDYAKSHQATVRKVVAALAAASAKIKQSPSDVARQVQKAFYPKVSLAAITSGLQDLAVTGGGRMSAAMWDNVIALQKAVGTELPSGMSGASGEGTWWTNEYLPAGSPK